MEMLLRYPLVSGLFGCSNHVWKGIKRGKQSNPAFISIDFPAPFASQNQRCHDRLYNPGISPRVLVF